MRRRSQYALVFMLVLALTAGVVGAGWGLNNPYISTISKTAPFAYSNQLTATVTYNPQSGLYHYLYSLVYSASANNGKLTSFSIANLNNLASTGWGCSESSLVHATSSSSVLWNSGTVSTGRTVTFWYDSVHPYGEVNVTVTGGLPSGGYTLGMVPEPSSLLAMAFGLGGVFWTRLRRRS